MALVVKDRVRESSTSTGTGTITLNGAVTGFQSFTVIGNTNTTYYTIVDGATGAWEVGIGTYTASGTTLSRDTILESSNAGAAVDFAAGIKDVFCTYPAERSIYTDAAGSIITPATASTLAVVSGGSGAATLTGYLKGNGTSAFTGSSTIPNTDISGLGTMSTQNANGVVVTGGTIDGTTIGGSTAAAGTFTTLTTSSTVTHNGGTANGVAYLNGSKVLTTGSALTFDGAILGVNGVSVGRGAGAVATNTAVGAGSLASNTTASNNTAVGYQAGYSNTTGFENAYFGMQSGYSNTVGARNSFFGWYAGRLSTGESLTGFGQATLANNTTGSYNVAVGTQALQANTTASNNTAVGYQAGYSNTTGIINTYIGDLAGYSNQTGSQVTYLGRQAGYSCTVGGNTFIGSAAGYSVTTGTKNTFVGGGDAATIYPSGYFMTTGSANTILGNFNGNQGGLDIRTLSNYLVLSDGDGNPRIYHNGTTVVIPSLPTSSAGLPSGGLWNDSGTLKVA